MTYRISFFHLAIPYRMNAYYPDDFKLQSESECAILATHSSPFHKVLGKQTPHHHFEKSSEGDVFTHLGFFPSIR